MRAFALSWSMPIGRPAFGTLGSLSWQRFLFAVGDVGARARVGRTVTGPALLRAGVRQKGSAARNVRASRQICMLRPRVWRMTGLQGAYAMTRMRTGDSAMTRGPIISRARKKYALPCRSRPGRARDYRPGLDQLTDLSRFRTGPQLLDLARP